MTTEVHLIAQAWVAASASNTVAFGSLFAQDGFWRDMIAFTNDFHTIAKGFIRQAAIDRLPIAEASNARITTPLPAVARPFPDFAFIEVHFTFDTKIRLSIGVAKLIPVGDKKYAAYFLFTFLVHGHQPQLGAHRILGKHNTRTS
ncbi:hypothetical protein V1525DRAFT_441687 [Lipomyces kononenkoae]|uniref:Uncharacterized protein n=1 Tax=Lipomyces kononenkoae TaxID=34357 RepID=A0ACC3SQ09_LIPKO